MSCHRSLLAFHMENCECPAAQSGVSSLGPRWLAPLSGRGVVPLSGPQVGAGAPLWSGWLGLSFLGPTFEDFSLCP